MRYEIRELDVGGILDHAINLTKDNFWLFLKIALVLMVPFNIVSGLMILWSMPEVPPGATQAQIAAAMQQVVATMALKMGIIQLVNVCLVLPISDAAMIYAIANQYLDKPVSMAAAFRRALKIFVPLVLTWLLTGLVVGLGFVLLIIPGIIFLLWFMLVSRVVVVEGRWGTGAMTRSKQLMKGNMGTGLVLSILTFVIMIAFNWVPGLVPIPELTVILRAIAQSILAIFFSAVLVVFYFSCRCKAENFDLTMLADAVVVSEPLSGAPDAAVS
jgi:hypothetical protein